MVLTANTQELRTVLCFARRVGSTNSNLILITGTTKGERIDTSDACDVCWTSKIEDGTIDAHKIDDTTIELLLSVKTSI